MNITKISCDRKFAYLPIKMTNGKLAWLRTYRIWTFIRPDENGNYDPPVVLKEIIFWS